MTADKLYCEYHFLKTSDLNAPKFNNKITNKSVIRTAFNSGKNSIESTILLMMYIQYAHTKFDMDSAFIIKLWGGSGSISIGNKNAIPIAVRVWKMLVPQ